MTFSSAPMTLVASPAARHALPIAHSPGNPIPMPPLPPSCHSSTWDQRPSSTLHESIKSQKGKCGCADPELAAILVNCNTIEGEVEDPEPPNKVAKKKEANKDFFNIIMKTGTIKISCTFFLL